MKKFFVIVLIFLIGVGVGIWLANKDKVFQYSQEYQNSLPSFQDGDAPAELGEIKSEIAKVTRVIDGDTIEIEGGQRVRYIGIDTPETVDPRKPVQCFGAEASKKNRELVEGQTVRLEKDVTDRDRYGRLLRYVYVGDTFINLELVRQGFAYSYTYPPDVKYQDQILKAQQEAEQAKAGLWSACPPKDSPNSESASANASASGDGSCIIKGNISAAGEKIYHSPGCGSYSKTVISESQGEKWFCTEAEAEAAGWRKALNCP